MKKVFFLILFAFSVNVSAGSIESLSALTQLEEVKKTQPETSSFWSDLWDWIF